MIKDFKQELIYNLSTILSVDDVNKVSTVLDVVLNDYIIEPKSHELALIDENKNATLLKNFLCIKKLEGRSEKTIKHYQHIIQKMMDEIGKDVTTLTTNDIRYYLANYQMQRQISTVTLDNMRCIYNSFFKFLEQEDIISVNPMYKIKKFKIPKKKIEAFTERELETLFDSCETLRDRALLEFLYSTGARVSEVAAVNIDDIDFKKATCLIKHGKGDKERITYISEKCMYWLEKYMETRDDNDVCLWLGRRGRLTKSGIEAVIKRVSDKSGIPAHPHKFRHTLATDMIKRGAPLQIVQQILGHEDISTTMVYVDIANSDVEHMHKNLIS